MLAAMYTDAEMERQFGIADVLKAYNAELKWAAKNREANRLIRIDPSERFITAREKRDFDAWCPVSSL